MGNIIFLFLAAGWMADAWILPVHLRSMVYERALENITAEIKASPDEPYWHFQKCRMLFAKGMEQEAIDYAAVVMEKIIASGDEQRKGFLVGTFPTEKHRIHVIYNTTRAERAEHKMWIVRPYSFHVWTRDDPPEFLKSIDWEFNYAGGVPITAAVGEMKGVNHVNYGVLPVESDFATVKAWVLRVLEKEVVVGATLFNEKGEGRIEIYADKVIDADAEVEKHLPVKTNADVLEPGVY